MVWDGEGDKERDRDRDGDGDGAKMMLWEFVGTFLPEAFS